jgi:hypothetical protein
MNIDEKVIAALDLVYPPGQAPADVPASNVRRGPWLNRYSIATAVAAALVLILAYPAVTAISTGSHHQPAHARAGTVTSLASLHAVVIDARNQPRIKSAVLDGHRVTAWVASVGRSGKYVYHLDNSQLTEFSAVLPATDSGLTDPCSWTVQLGGGTRQTYRTQPAANVPMNISGSGTVSIMVAPAQPSANAANCVMTDPVVQPVPGGGAAASSTPVPVASQGLASPPVVQPAVPAPPTVQQAQPTTPPATASPPASPSATPSASPSASPSGAPTRGATPTSSAPATGQATAPATDPAEEPEGGD